MTAPARLPAHVIEEFGKQVLHAGGMSADDADIVSHHLTLASLRGVDSHGLVRYAMYARRVRDGGMVSPTTVTFVNSGGTVSLIDGADGVGQVIGQRAMEHVVEQANRSGIAAAAVRSSNHLGALSPYTILAAEAGCIGIAMTNASPRMAPAGGAQALLGNNPWSIAIPGRDRPVVMDMANSVAALGKVRMMKARGELMPEGWARDNDGLPTRDPEAAISGLLEPIAGYKGYILALMIDLMTGALAGGVSSTGVGVLTDTSRPGRTGHFFLALSVSHMRAMDDFLGDVESVTDSVRSSRRAPGVSEILVPGDIEARIEADRRAHGIPLTQELLNSVRHSATEFGLPVPTWAA